MEIFMKTTMTQAELKLFKKSWTEYTQFLFKDNFEYLYIVIGYCTFISLFMFVYMYG